jgi:hypothetical protein
MHGKGERGRTAVMRKLAQHRRQFRNLGAAAAQFPRHTGLDETGFFQCAVILGDEAVIFIRVGRASGKFRA